MKRYGAGFCFLVFSMVMMCGGCANPIDPTIPSSAVKTKDMYCEYDVMQYGDRISATAAFRKGDYLGANIRLSDADQITVNGETMYYANLVVIKGYFAEVPASDKYEFKLVRRGEGEYPSSTTIPAAFTISSPDGYPTYSRQEPFTITWAPVGGADQKVNLTFSGKYLVTGDCPHGDIPDNGSCLVAAGSLKTEQGAETTTDSAKIDLRRSVDGVLDSALKGWITGVYSETAAFVSKP